MDFLGYLKKALTCSKEEQLRSREFVDSVSLPKAFGGIIGEKNDYVASAALGGVDQYLKASWADSGFPVFVPSVNLVASLRLSDIRIPPLDIELPFRSFVVRFPPEPELILGSHPVAFVNFSVCPLGPVGGAKLFDEHGAEMRVAVARAFRTDGSCRFSSVVLNAAASDISKVRHSYLQTREVLFLCFGLSLYVSEVDRGVRQATKRGYTRAQKAEGEALRHAAVWIVGKDVKIRPELLEAARSSGTTRAAFEIHSRFVVRGHWRNQAHGPAHQLRRRQWIQPHWKGPEAGQQLLRAYSVETETDAKR